MLRREREQLHELAGLPQPPRPARDRLSVPNGPEATQQPDPDVAHNRSMTHQHTAGGFLPDR